MKHIVNRPFLIIFCILLHNNAIISQTETKNVVRIGAGANFSDHVSGEKYSTGTAMEAEYQYTLSKYIGITANLSTIKLSYGENYDLSDISFAIGQ
jgi:hypothetical protein